MIAHGISSAGMFFMVGVVYDRVHHRNLNEFGGLFAKMPVYSGLSMIIFFAGLGLPGLCGFIGEVLVVLSVWNFSKALAVISAFVVILTAGYILWTLQRVYLGPEYRGPHGEALVPMTLREIGIAAPLVVFAIFFGVYPNAVFRYMSPSVDQTAQELAEWTRETKTPRLEAERAESEDAEATASVPAGPEPEAREAAAEETAAIVQPAKEKESLDESGELSLSVFAKHAFTQTAFFSPQPTKP